MNAVSQFFLIVVSFQASSASCSYCSIAGNTMYKKCFYQFIELFRLSMHCLVCVAISEFLIILEIKHKALQSSPIFEN